MSLNPYKATLIKDPMDKRLYEKCKRVAEPRSIETFMIVDRMKFIQKEARGIGLAANQIGINRSIITAFHEGTQEILEFINPRITDGTPQEDGNVLWDIEGCLSHPGIRGEVARYSILEFEAQRMKDTKPQIFKAQGMLARIIQHEIDHINGRLFTDLGAEVRNITIDSVGQVELFEATRKAQEDDTQEFVLD